jgi:N-acetylmuramoyl-L-alanine amidase
MKEVIYNTLDEVPAYAKPTILKLISKGYLNGDGKGNYALTLDMIRVFVIHDRIGLYDK